MVLFSLRHRYHIIHSQTDHVLFENKLVVDFAPTTLTRRPLQNLTLLIVGYLLSILLFSVVTLNTFIFLPFISFINAYFRDTFMDHKHAQDLNG